MKIQHLKSPCCGSRGIKYGQRRRQCILCLKTWRIRKKKSGRKQKRVSSSLAMKLFESHSTIRQRIIPKHMTERQYQRRMASSLKKLDDRKLYDFVPSNFPLILLIDGVWAHAEKKRAVIYLLAVRATTEKTAYLLPPHVSSGSESNRKWQSIIDNLPMMLRRRIVALVCDGLSGMTEKSAERGWKVQRCQFHYIKTIERFRGKKNRFIKHKIFREKMYRRIREVLTTKNENDASEIFEKIEKDSKQKICPKWIRVLVKELLRYRREFRTCFTNPSFNLPATNSCMESLAGIVRHRLYLARGFKTLKSLGRWVRGLIYYQKTITCNGNHQPRKRR